MTKDNKSDGADVNKDQPAKPAVAPSKRPISADDVASEIAATPEGEKKVGEKEEEKTGTDGTSKETKTETTPPETTPPTSTEPFAKLGSREFKDKDELLQFTRDQSGFGRWLVGKVKKTHPDWFNPDGSMKTQVEIDKVLEATTKVKDAATTVAKRDENPGEVLTPEQEEELKKAKAILKKLGVVFSDDEDFRSIRESATMTEQERQDAAHDLVQEFYGNHPIALEHKDDFGDFVSARKYTDIEKAWQIFKIENDVNEPTTTVKTAVKPVETVLPASTQKDAGKAPSKATDKDLMDDLISLPGAIR